MLLRGWVSVASYVQVDWEDWYAVVRRSYCLSVDTWTPSSSSYLVISLWEEARGNAASQNLSGVTIQGVRTWPCPRSVEVRAPLANRQRLERSAVAVVGRPSGVPLPSCHADIIRAVFSRRFPDAYDRDSGSAKPPTAQILNYMAKLRVVPEQSDGSSADEGAPERAAGWMGHGTAN